jgi:hypothetical protein
VPALRPPQSLIDHGGRTPSTRFTASPISTGRGDLEQEHNTQQEYLKPWTDHARSLLGGEGVSDVLPTISCVRSQPKLSTLSTSSPQTPRGWSQACHTLSDICLSFSCAASPSGPGPGQAGRFHRLTEFCRGPLAGRGHERPDALDDHGILRLVLGEEAVCRGQDPVERDAHVAP